MSVSRPRATYLFDVIFALLYHVCNCTPPNVISTLEREKKNKYSITETGKSTLISYSVKHFGLGLGGVCVPGSGVGKGDVYFLPCPGRIGLKRGKHKF